MGVIRAEPARVTDWAAKSVGAAWRAFDLQLTTYAGLELFRRYARRIGLHDELLRSERRARIGGDFRFGACVTLVVAMLLIRS